MVAREGGRPVAPGDVARQDGHGLVLRPNGRQLVLRGEGTAQRGAVHEPASHQHLPQAPTAAALLGKGRLNLASDSSPWSSSHSPSRRLGRASAVKRDPPGFAAAGGDGTGRVHHLVVRRLARTAPGADGGHAGCGSVAPTR